MEDERLTLRRFLIMAFSMAFPWAVLGCGGSAVNVYDGAMVPQSGYSSYSGGADSGLETDAGGVVYWADVLTLTYPDGSQRIFRDVYYGFEGGFWTSHNDFELSAVSPVVPTSYPFVFAGFGTGPIESVANLFISASKPVDLTTSTLAGTSTTILYHCSSWCDGFQSDVWFYFLKAITGEVKLFSTKNSLLYSLPCGMMRRES